MSEIDRLDSRILAELQQNGRISNTELAQPIGLSASVPVTAESHSDVVMEEIKEDFRVAVSA